MTAIASASVSARPVAVPGSRRPRKQPREPGVANGLFPELLACGCARRRRRARGRRVAQRRQQKTASAGGESEEEEDR